MAEMPRRSPSAPVEAFPLPEGFCACPVDIAFRAVGRKWTIHVIRNLLQGQRHFNEFLTSIEGINPKMLSARLKELEHEHLVLKRVSSSSPVRIEYALTERGYALLPILRQMVRWSVEFAPDRVFSGGKIPRELERCVADWEQSLAAFNAVLVTPDKGPLVRNRAPPKTT